MEDYIRTFCDICNNEITFSEGYIAKTDLTEKHCCFSCYHLNFKKKNLKMNETCYFCHEDFGENGNRFAAYIKEKDLFVHICGNCYDKEKIEEGIIPTASEEGLTQEILNQRAETHGDYVSYCKVAHTLMSIAERTDVWSTLTALEAQSLRMIIHKLARILNSPKFCEDNFRDLAGYAELVCKNKEE